MDSDEFQLTGRRAVHALSILACAFTVAYGASLRAQIIDRVLAVVSGKPITLSDVTAAVRFGLVDYASSENPDDAALNALIERQLQLIEVNRYLPPEPEAAEIDLRLAQLRARFPDAAPFERALEDTGVTPAQLRANLRDSIRIENYLRQRFGAGYQPSEDEVQRYYRVNTGEFVRDGVVRPYAEVRDLARKRLIEERASALVREWTESLRRRVDVTILPKTPLTAACRFSAPDRGGRRPA